jgi:anti-sigma regulatory factor (Ser/Thr protein kinase)
VSNSSINTTYDPWWQRLRPRLTIAYLLVALVLLIISLFGHTRLLGEVGKTFGGFFWGIDTDGQVVIVSTLPQSGSFGASASSLTNTDHIIGVVVNKKNGEPVYSWQQNQSHPEAAPLTAAYKQASPGDGITYTVQHSNDTTEQTVLPAIQFSWGMWFENYGLALLAGMSWLLVGTILLVSAQDWTGAVEGITMLPPAMLFLLYSHWGNVQQTYPADSVFQLLWVPSFALLGAAFIHLSLTYRPEAMSVPRRRPRLMIDGLPYLPLIALVAFEWSSFVIFGRVAGRLHFIVALGYGVFGGVLSLVIGVISLLRVSRILPGKRIPDNVRRRLGDLLTLWIGGVGLGFCLGILPILLTGQPLLPLEIFFALAIVYPLLLLYAIRSLRLIDQLQITLEQREEALREQQQTAKVLQGTNSELQQATSLLLHADAHLRSVLSQRIHDQPKQQALRIRSLLGHWQHKLKVEAERDPDGKVAVKPISEALGKVRKISEELEGDLRGLQLLVEDAYQRRSLGLKLHLEKLIREDLPALHPESPLKVQPDLWALDALSHDLEQSEDGTKIAEAISYTVTQALLNVYNHAGAGFATVQTVRKNGHIEVYITDDGRGFDTSSISPEKTSLFKARLKAREAGGILAIQSVPRPQVEHGTTVILRLPIPQSEITYTSGPLPESRVYEI